MSRRRKTRASVFGLALAASTAAIVSAVVVACGIDAVATKEFPGVVPDGASPTEASLPPEGDGAPGDGGGPDVVVDAAEAGCPSKGGPMVEVTAGGSTFCIDGTEVTNGEYAKFVAATDGGKVTDGSVPPSPTCIKSTFSPAGSGSDDLPAVNVDWCDAYGFCKWAGKRLCGKTTGADAASGEWYAACSNGGAQDYPYGASYVAGRCRESSGGPVAAGSMPGCQGSVPGLFDMNGNVSEYIDNCTGLTCSVMGGDYSGIGSCKAEGTPLRSTAAGFIGFRCCADAP